MFHDILFILDYPAVELIFQRGVLEKGSGVLAREFQGRLPEIQANLNGHFLTTFIDSGSTAFMTIPADLPSIVRFKSEPRLTGRGRTVNREFDVKEAQLDGILRLGALEVGQPTLRTIDLLPMGTLGYDFCETTRSFLTGKTNVFDFKLNTSRKNCSKSLWVIGMSKFGSAPQQTPNRVLLQGSPPFVNSTVGDFFAKIWNLMRTGVPFFGRSIGNGVHPPCRYKLRNWTPTQTAG